jgi:hypothetical protein
VSTDRALRLGRCPRTAHALAEDRIATVSFCGPTWAPGPRRYGDPRAHRGDRMGSASCAGVLLVAGCRFSRLETGVLAQPALLPTRLMSKASAQLEQERREEVAAAAVASVVGARFRRRDIGGRQVHDFDLEFEDGALEALEVCTFTDSTVREQWQILRELDVVASQLTSTWTVSVVWGARVKRLPERAEPYLATLERYGRSAFESGSHYQLAASGAPADLLAASWALVELGVRDAVRAPQIAGEPARVLIAAGSGGAARTAVMSRVVQKVASKRDNRLKLQAARGARRRHIVVPIDPSAAAVWSIAREVPAGDPPRLPASVTVAWVIGPNGRTLRVELPGSWEAVKVDRRVWGNPALWRA